MTQNDRDRIKLIAELHAGALHAEEVAKLLRVSMRQVYRLHQRYCSEGDAGLIHRLRGRSSNRGYPATLRTKVVKLYWDGYRDYGSTLFSEQLLKEHTIALDHETVRRWLNAQGGANVQRKKRPHRRKRPRRAAIGELVQFAGSPHDWFEGRGPSCVLLHALDDASSRVFLRLVPSENRVDVLRTLRVYCERFGIPRALYCDHGTVFFAENGTLTDVGRAMKLLGVAMVFANSPQAKGRVERGNRTQPAAGGLIKAFRREGISTIEQANRYLDQDYLAEHNKQFSHTQGLPDVHRSGDGFPFDTIFCLQTTRQLRNDFTIALDGQYVPATAGCAESIHCRRHDTPSSCGNSLMAPSISSPTRMNLTSNSSIRNLRRNLCSSENLLQLILGGNSKIKRLRTRGKHPNLHEEKKHDKLVRRHHVFFLHALAQLAFFLIFSYSFTDISIESMTVTFLKSYYKLFYGFSCRNSVSFYRWLFSV